MNHRTFWTEKHSAVSLLRSGIGQVPWYVFMSISPQLSIQCYPNKVIISHNEEFVNALCQYRTYLRTYTRLIAMLGPEIWNISEGRMTHKGKAAVVEEAFADFKSPRGSGSNTPVRSRVQTPIASTAGTPAASGAEDKGNPAVPVVKKKKLTRNQMKVQEERRRLRKLHWLQFGGPKPEDSDD